MVGAKVRISKKSRYYKEESPVNPRDVEGVVLRVGKATNDLNIDVSWGGGFENSYNKEDLVIV